MATIRIGVIDPSQSSKTTMEVPDDVPVDQLAEAMIEVMGLPSKDSSGKKLNYSLSLLTANESFERLTAKSTLSEIGVESGAVLQLSPEIVAGCFLPGTMISLPEGNYLPIERIKPGNNVLSFDTDKNVFCTGIVSDVYVGEEDAFLIINDILHITESHLIFSNDNWIQAKYLTKGDLLKTESGTSLLVENIKAQKTRSTVYNLHLATQTHTFFAEQILVHNLYQKYLRITTEQPTNDSEKISGLNDINLSSETIENLAEVVSRKIEAFLLVKLGEVTDLTSDEKKLVKGTMLVRPSFGIPSEMSQYKCDVFMIMPFRDEFNAIYKHFIVEVVKSFNLTIKRGDDFFSSSNSNIMDEIWSAINSCRFIVADCTGRNPNVFYEIGIAHVLGKPTILLTQNIDDVPFDVQTKRFVKYQNNAEGLKELEVKLRDIIRILLSEGNDETNDSKRT
jgi:hypothetical protein